LTTLDVARQLLLGTGRNAVRAFMGRERSWPGLRTLLEAFYSAIQRGAPPPVPAMQGVRVAELLEEIRRHLERSPTRIAGESPPPAAVR
jgi:predicted dehydrogenase